jgi:hypothetical protein
MDGSAFDTYVETQIAPTLPHGTAVILDRLSTHRSPHANAALKAKACWFLFLPADSPNLNPIRIAFSNLKAHLRRLEPRSFEHFLEALAGLCRLITTTECENFWLFFSQVPDHVTFTGVAIPICSSAFMAWRR